MKRVSIPVLAIAATLMLAACGGQQAAGPGGGAGAADRPPRLQQEGAPYPPQGAAAEEPLLGDAPVLNMEEQGQPGQPGARQGAGSPAAPLSEEEQRAAAPGTGQGGNPPQVAALIPNRGPYTPVRELGRIHFGFDADELTAQAKRVLDGNARWLLEHPEVRVRVEGHCDERGTNEYNLGLGQRRADRVVRYLIGQGVQAKSLLAVSFGEELPLTMGHDEFAWAQNRRVDFSYLDDNQTGQVTTFNVMPLEQ